MLNELLLCRQRVFVDSEMSIISMGLKTKLTHTGYSVTYIYIMWIDLLCISEYHKQLSSGMCSVSKLTGE